MRESAKGPINTEVIQQEPQPQREAQESTYRAVTTEGIHHKENDRKGGERANRGIDERSGKRKKSDTTEKKRKQVEYRGELTSL
ncbi:TPA: hypothetical protein ROX84_001791 [Bacillus thuringiensis]|nr:hypothetical protein [Bacillus thuringiensis]